MALHWESDIRDLSVRTDPRKLTIIVRNLVGNALNPYLSGYDSPTRLNIFSLPAPEYSGDRRMFRFMHNGWHNADNGGLNVLYRGRGDGTFEKLDPAAMGLQETRW